MNSMISFDKKCAGVAIRRSPKKARVVGKVVVSPPRGPARPRPATRPLFIYCLARSLSRTHSFDQFTLPYSRGSTIYPSAEKKAARLSGMKPASRNNTSAQIVITAALDLRRKPSVSTSISSSSQRSSTSEGSEFKKSDLVADGDLIDNSKPLDRVYRPATMSRTSINIPQNELPAVAVSPLPEASNLREFTSPTPSGDSSPPPAQYTSPLTTLTRPGDEDLFVKVPQFPETAGLKDQQSQFVLPSPPLTRVGTKSTQKSTPSRPGSGRRESQNLGGQEEVDVTDTCQWQGSQVDDPNPRLDHEGGQEKGEITSSSRGITITHPLKLNIPPNSHSPPPWELIGPPEDDEVPHRTTNETLTAHQCVSCLPLLDHFSSIPIARSSNRLIPKSSYYYGPPPPDTAFGTDPIGQIGIHHPREIVRIERDYSGGEIIQFSAVYPLEFEGRVCLQIPRVQSPPRSLTCARMTDNTDAVPRVDKRNQRNPDFCSQLVPFMPRQRVGLFHVAVITVGKHHSL